MRTKFVTCCSLLAALAGATALAQTHPKKKLVRKTMVVHEKWPTRMRDKNEAFLLHTYDRLDTAYHAQPTPPESDKVYTYVEQMPTLNGQEAYRASTAAINRYLVVPPTAPNGRMFVKFEVSKDGRVRHPQIVKGLRADLDSAVLVATRHLPQFTPGKQNGKVVTVSFTLPITIPVKKQP